MSAWRNRAQAARSDLSVAAVAIVALTAVVAAWPFGLLVALAFIAVIAVRGVLQLGAAAVLAAIARPTEAVAVILTVSVLLMVSGCDARVAQPGGWVLCDPITQQAWAAQPKPSGFSGHNLHRAPHLDVIACGTRKGVQA